MECVKDGRPNEKRKEEEREGKVRKKDKETPLSSSLIRRGP